MEILMDVAPAKAVLLDMKRYYFKKIEDRSLLPFIPTLSYLRESYENSLFIDMKSEASTPNITKLEEKIITRALDASHELERVAAEAVQEIKKTGKITTFEEKENFKDKLDDYYQKLIEILKNTLNDSYDDFFKSIARDFEAEPVVIRLSSVFCDGVTSTLFKINDFIEEYLYSINNKNKKNTGDIKFLFEEIRKDISKLFFSWGFEFYPAEINKA